MKRSDVIKALIDLKSSSINGFAASIGMSSTTLHSIIKRGVGNSSVDNVLKICKGLGITCEELEQLAESDMANIKYREEEMAKYSEENILTIAAHKAGHEEDLSKEDMDKIRLAIKIALMKNDKNSEGD